MTTTKTILAALAGVLLSTLAACDQCHAAIAIHMDRCQAGESESCEWLQTHVNPPGSEMCEL